MRHAVPPERMQARIAENDFGGAAGGRVHPEHILDIFS